MQEIERRKRIWNIVQLVTIALLCVFAVVLDFLEIPYLKDELRNRMLSKIIQQTCGMAAAILLMIRLRVRLFGKPKGWLYLIPCLIIAIDNFQFSSYFNGYMELIHKDAWDFILYGGYCLAVGLFEECVFRGVVFSVVLGFFPQNKKGFLWAFILSSLIFGFAHFLNGFSLGVLRQVGYTILTGGLFTFCLIKTKNIFCCGFVHALYNFGGMLFAKFNAQTGEIGLGSGVVFDTGTVITMLVVSILVGLFVFYSVLTYKDEERLDLYGKLGIKLKERAEKSE